MGDKMGRIHLGRQDLDELQTRKMKGLKRSRDALNKDDGKDEVEDIDLVDYSSDASVDDDGNDDDESGGVDNKRPRLDS